MAKKISLLASGSSLQQHLRTIDADLTLINTEKSTVVLPTALSFCFNSPGKYPSAATDSGLVSCTGNLWTRTAGARSINECSK